MTSTTAMLSSSVSPLLSQRPCPEVLPSICLWLGATEDRSAHARYQINGEQQAASFVDSLASLAIDSEKRAFTFAVIEPRLQHLEKLGHGTNGVLHGEVGLKQRQAGLAVSSRNVSIFHIKPATETVCRR